MHQNKRRTLPRNSGHHSSFPNLMQDY